MASLPPQPYYSSPLSRTSASSTYYSQTQSIHPSRLREAQQQKMAYAHTMQLAQRARVKLQREASRHDHDLRLLVGHANLLDSLMIALSAAEREEAHWFNDAVRGNMMSDEEEVEQESGDWPQPEQEWLAADYYSESSDSEEEDEEDSDSECGSDDEMEDVTYTLPRLTRKPSQPSLPSSFFSTVIGVSEVEEYDEDFEPEEEEQEEVDEDGLYPLQRSPSHGSPPQLVEDLSDDDEEEATPPSPPQLSLPFSPKAKERLVTTSYYEKHPHPPETIVSSSHEHSQDPYFPETDFLRSAPMISTF